MEVALMAISFFLVKRAPPEEGTPNNYVSTRNQTSKYNNCVQQTVLHFGVIL